MSQIGKLVAIAALLPIATVGSWAQQGGDVPSKRPHNEIPLYRVTFEQGEPIKGLGAAPAFRLPFHCSDGTTFITTVQPLRADAPPPKDPLQLNPFLLISVAPSGEAHSFPLNRATDLYSLHQISEASSESKVVFLVSAAAEDRPEKEGDGDSGGSRRESAKDRTERHDYLVIFDREGNYQRRIQLESAFRITHLSLFPTGSFLAYGYDEQDDTPKLALLKEDGSLLKLLEIPKGDAPDSVLQRNSSGRGPSAYLGLTEFVPQGQYIYFLQADSDYPILRVSAGGGVNAIKPTLPAGERIAMLVPSDENLYAIIHNADGSGKPKEESILELDALDGAVLRQLEIGKDESAYELACVHDKKFLVFHHGDGQLIPLVGTAQPASETVHTVATDR